MNDKQIFGAFLKVKRNRREITVRDMANMVGLKVGNYCDIESGRRSPMDNAFLDRVVNALHVSEDDRDVFFDLARKAR